MISKSDLEMWNLQTLALMQALLGAVSRNFRMVVLRQEIDIWIIDFVLELDDHTDREEIEEVVTQFEALQDGSIKCDVNIDVTSGPIDWPAAPARVIFRRREE